MELNKNEDTQEYTVSKPLSLLYREFVKKTVDNINESKLPAFVLKSVFQNFLSQIELLETQEYQNDMMDYQKMTKHQ